MEVLITMQSPLGRAPHLLVTELPCSWYMESGCVPQLGGGILLVFKSLPHCKVTTSIQYSGSHNNSYHQDVAHRMKCHLLLLYDATAILRSIHAVTKQLYPARGGLNNNTPIQLKLIVRFLCAKQIGVARALKGNN